MAQQFGRKDVAAYITKKTLEPNITPAEALASIKEDFAALKAAGNTIDSTDLAAGVASFAKANGLSNQQFAQTLNEIDSTNIFGGLGIDNASNLESLTTANSAATRAAAPPAAAADLDAGIADLGPGSAAGSGPGSAAGTGIFNTADFQGAANDIFTTGFDTAPEIFNPDVISQEAYQNYINILRDMPKEEAQKKFAADRKSIQASDRLKGALSTTDINNNLNEVDPTFFDYLDMGSASGKAAAQSATANEYNDNDIDLLGEGAAAAVAEGSVNNIDLNSNDSPIGLSTLSGNNPLTLGAAAPGAVVAEGSVNNIDLNSNDSPMRLTTLSGNDTLTLGPGGKTASQESYVQRANGDVVRVQAGEGFPAGTLVDAATYAKFRRDNGLPIPDYISAVTGGSAAGVGSGVGAAAPGAAAALGAGVPGAAALGAAVTGGLDENGLTAEQAQFYATLDPSLQAIYLQAIQGTNEGTALPDVLKGLLGQGFNLNQIGQATGLIPQEEPSLYSESDGGVAGPGQMLPNVLNSEGIMAPFKYTPFPAAQPTATPVPRDVMALTAGLKQPAAAAGAPAPVQPDFPYNPAFGIGTTEIDIFKQPNNPPNPFVPPVSKTA